MKKLLLALSLILTFAAQSVSAQVEFHWGFKGGLNFTTYDSDADDAQARMGQWGALCRWQIGSNFAIQPELFYSRMGIRSLRKQIAWNQGEKPFNPNAYDFPNRIDHYDGEDFRLKLLTDNIQMPIIFKYYVPQQILPGINLHAGPLFSQRLEYHVSTSTQLSYLRDYGSTDFNDGITADDQIYTQQDLYENGSNTLNFAGSLRRYAHAQHKFTVHYVVGIGYDSPTGIGFDFRFQQGITPVWKSNHAGCYNANSHDRVWAICFSYVF